MTKKLEEELNLPNLEELSEEELKKPQLLKKSNKKLQSIKVTYMVERADAALPTVEGLEQLDREMDEYAGKAMDTFEDQLIGKNVEDRHAV